jgi:3-deoxy-D-manno-octulosonic-acid transferase
MLYLIYDMLLLLAVPLLVPWYLCRYVRRGRLRKGIGERLGFIPREKCSLLDGSETIWVHAVSVGETMAVRPLLKALKARYPERKIVLSTVTETGRGIAEKLPDADLCIYFPFDFRFAVQSALEKVRPSLIVVVETEIWPNFLRHARLRGIPAVLANGRISDKSFGGYRRFSWIFRPVLENFSAFCMQTEEDARRIAAIGAPCSRVHVAGNLKYDIPVLIVPQEKKEKLRAKYRIPVGVPVVTFGSTHQGEEAAVLAACLTLSGEGREFFLVLAPRHPERAGEVEELLQRCGISFSRRSTLTERSRMFNPGESLLVDTVGELMDLYSISDLVFVGGSLVPVGGHNILEPASLGVPVLFGPHMNNFREIASRILGCGGGVQIEDSSMLTTVIRDLLDSPAARQEMGEKGARLLQEHSGSTGRHMAIISSVQAEGRCGATGLRSPREHGDI